MAHIGTVSKILLCALSMSALSACSVFGIRSGTDEPPFVAVEQVGALEIRRYGPRLAADTIVQGDEEDALNTGFSRLADYIFGNNAAAQNIDMTAPVAQSSMQIAMTAPVVRENLEDGRYRIRFFMPSSYDLSSLPKPNSADVEIVAVPEQEYAVVRYSGNHSMSASMERQEELLSQLASTPWRASGPASTWFYDPPWTLPWLRRNEVAVPISR